MYQPLLFSLLILRQGLSLYLEVLLHRVAGQQAPAAARLYLSAFKLKMCSTTYAQAFMCVPERYTQLRQQCFTHGIDNPFLTLNI